jgi:hypothetical protein
VLEASDRFIAAATVRPLPLEELRHNNDVDMWVAVYVSSGMRGWWCTTLMQVGNRFG